MKLKINIVLFFLCGGILLQNCELGDDCNFGSVDEFFDIQNMNYAVFKTDGQMNCCNPIN